MRKYYKVAHRFLLSFASAVLPKDVKLNIKRKAFDRKDLIISQINEDDKVLAIGCVKHSLGNIDLEDEDDFLFTKLNAHADHVIGVDIVEEGIEELNRLGYEAYVEDAQEMNLNQKFDKIVAGEVIEHIENPGRFLKRCQEHLKPSGKIIITTPNPRRLQMLLWFLFNEDQPGNPEHTMWFDWFVMEELASRVGLELDSYSSYAPGYLPVSLILYRAGLANTLTAGGWVFVLK